MAEREGQYQSTQAAIEAWLDKLGCDYEAGERGGIVAEIELGGNVYSTFTIPLISGFVMLFDLGQDIQPAIRPQISTLLLEINDRIPYGGFELSKKPDRLTYKISTFFDGKSPSPTLMSRCLGAAAANIDRYIAGIKGAVEGIVDPSVVVKMSETNDKRSRNVKKAALDRPAE